MGRRQANIEQHLELLVRVDVDQNKGNVANIGPSFFEKAMRLWCWYAFMKGNNGQEVVKEDLNRLWLAVEFPQF